MNKRNNLVNCFVSLLIAFLILGCNSGEIVHTNFNFEEKVAIETLDNGWVYYINLCFADKSAEANYCGFNGFNLKYNILEDYKVEVVDANGLVVGYNIPSLPWISANEASLHDLDWLNELWEENIPTTPIGSWPEDFEWTFLDPGQVMRLLNEALVSDFCVEGKYWYLRQADIVQEAFINGYQWQVGYLDIHGQIIAIHIDIIDRQGINLSDIVNSSNASDDQKACYSKILSIQDEIMSSGDFTSPEILKNSEDFYDFDRLKKLLAAIDTGEYMH